MNAEQIFALITGILVIVFAVGFKDFLNAHSDEWHW